MKNNKSDGNYVLEFTQNGKKKTQGYGYYNSKGSLVMDETMKKQLRTRGMNSTGVSSVVAGSAV